MRRKSLTDQRNDTLAGDMPPLSNSDVFNLPTKYMASGVNSLHAGIFSMLYVICLFYLIWVHTIYQGYQQAALVYKECGQAPLSTSSPGSQNHFHGKVNVQNENIFAWQKFQIFFGVLDIPDFLQTVDAGPNPTYEEKVRVPPPTTHTHPWSQSMMRSC